MSFLPRLPDRLTAPFRWLSLSALLLTGCGGIGIGAADLGAGQDIPGTATSDAGASLDSGSHGGGFDGGTMKRTGAEAGLPPAFFGSPLCQVAQCDPDQPACLYTAPGTNVDGGGDCTKGSQCSQAGATPAACHVGDTPDAGQVCNSTFNPNHRENAACASSSDCDIAYECVGGTDMTPGVCKHYCCEAATCKTVPSPDGGPEPFCDIETANTGQLVPVCAISPPCKPFEPNACPSGQTCTIVSSESGQTACVTVGTAQAGDECEDQKCDAGLACIGGACHQLCSPLDTCPTGQRCVQPTSYSSLGDFGLCT